MATATPRHCDDITRGWHKDEVFGSAARRGYASNQHRASEARTWVWWRDIRRRQWTGDENSWRRLYAEVGDLGSKIGVQNNGSSWVFGNHEAFLPPLLLPLRVFSHCSRDIALATKSLICSRFISGTSSWSKSAQISSFFCREATRGDDAVDFLFLDVEGVRVVEDFCRFAECDSVFFEVCFCFFLVPLITLHSLPMWCVIHENIMVICDICQSTASENLVGTRTVKLCRYLLNS